MKTFAKANYFQLVECLKVMANLCLKPLNASSSLATPNTKISIYFTFERN